MKAMTNKELTVFENFVTLDTNSMPIKLIHATSPDFEGCLCALTLKAIATSRGRRDVFEERCSTHYYTNAVDLEHTLSNCISGTNCPVAVLFSGVSPTPSTVDDLRAKGIQCLVVEKGDANSIYIHANAAALCSEEILDRMGEVLCKLNALNSEFLDSSDLTDGVKLHLIYSAFIDSAEKTLANGSSVDNLAEAGSKCFEDLLMPYIESGVEIEFPLQLIDEAYSKLQAQYKMFRSCIMQMTLRDDPSTTGHFAYVPAVFSSMPLLVRKYFSDENAEKFLVAYDNCSGYMHIYSDDGKIRKGSLALMLNNTPVSGDYYHVWFPISSILMGVYTTNSKYPIQAISDTVVH